MVVFFLTMLFSIMMNYLKKLKRLYRIFQIFPSERIRIAYKDITLSSSLSSTGARQEEGVFINILPRNPMVLREAFRNAYDSGSKSFKRIEIKLREVDSPCVAKMKKQNTNMNTTLTASRSKTEQQTSKELFPEKDWKISKLGDMNDHVQQLQDELVAVNVQLEEIKRPVIIEPPQLGQYKSIVCGKCHIRGRVRRQHADIMQRAQATFVLPITHAGKIRNIRNILSR